MITGGGGFVGQALARALRAEGHQVLCLSRGAYPELNALGIETARVDISAPSTEWQDLCKGYDGIFHTAAKVDMWGPREGFFRTNVIGTRNVIAVCRAAGIKNLVFTSSPSVIHDGKDLVGVDECYPYPRHHHAWYPETKAIAEREVREANDGATLRTVALRPHLIWGTGDTHLVPTIIERARAGRLTQIGDGTNLVDLTLIDDCVSAHIAAMHALERNAAEVFGKVYFISQGDPVNMWGWINQVLERNGLPAVSRLLPRAVAMSLAGVMEGIATVVGLCGIEYKPLLTRFLASEMSTHHYFSIEAARRDLGYIPSCTVDEAMERVFPADMKMVVGS